MTQKKRRARAKITDRKTFETAIWAAFEPYAVKLMDDEREWRKSVRERDPDGKQPPPVKNRAVRRDDLLLHEIFQAYREVTTSFDTLINIPFYMRHLPPSVSRKATSATWRGLSASRSAWVRYHVENYFHELYIFQNRVEAFFGRLRRSYRKQPYSTTLNEACDRLEKALKAGFGGVVRVRGSHVHERRFDDADLRMMEANEFLLSLNKISAREYRDFFQEVQTAKAIWMRSNNTQIRNWLDEGGRVLGELLFAEDGNFRFPHPRIEASPPPPVNTT
jgi:hypothetical protein